MWIFTAYKVYVIGMYVKWKNWWKWFLKGPVDNLPHNMISWSVMTPDGTDVTDNKTAVVKRESQNGNEEYHVSTVSFHPSNEIKAASEIIDKQIEEMKSKPSDGSLTFAVQQSQSDQDNRKLKLNNMRFDNRLSIFPELNYICSKILSKEGTYRENFSLLYETIKSISSADKLLMFRFYIYEVKCLVEFLIKELELKSGNKLENVYDTIRIFDKTIEEYYYNWDNQNKDKGTTVKEMVKKIKKELSNYNRDQEDEFFGALLLDHEDVNMVDFEVFRFAFGSLSEYQFETIMKVSNNTILLRELPLNVLVEALNLLTKEQLSQFTDLQKYVLTMNIPGFEFSKLPGNYGKVTR